MKATTRNATKWLLSLVFALVVISLILIPQVLKVESHADGYTRNESWDYSSSTPHITSVPDLLQMVYLCDQGTTFSGKTIYLDCDLDVNPGWDATVALSSTTGFALGNSTGTITLPTSPTTSWTNVATPNKGTNGGSGYCNRFMGTFDGQNHTISGVYAYKNASQSRTFGLLFNEVTGTVRNLAIVNSTIVWNQNSGYGGGGFGGVIGSLKSGATASNLYVEVNIVLQSNAHSKLAVGGIAGWSGGTMSQCAYIGRIIETSAQNSTTYPATVTTRHIGGITGESEEGSVTDCIAITTFAVKEPSVGQQKSDQSTTTGGANQAIAGHYGSDYGALTRVKEGVQTSSPGSNWTDCRNQLGTYLPTGAANALGRANAGSTIHISTAEQLLEVVRAVDQGLYTYYGTTIYLDNDIDLNPGWDASVTLSGASGTGLSASTGTITLPSAPSTLWPNVGTPNRGCGRDGVANSFEGTFNGQGHVIRGVYAYKSKDATRTFGILFNNIKGGTVQNLAITNSIIIENQNNPWGGAGFGGVFGAVYSGTVSNIYFEGNVVFQSNQGARYAFGGIIGWQEGGTVSNCVYKGMMVETDAADSLTYPSGLTTRHIGGIAGEVEGGTMNNCIGMPTFAVSEPSVALQATDQKTTTGGANLAVAGHYGSSYGTVTSATTYQGAVTSNPGNSYVDYTASSAGTWVPSGFASTFPFANGISIDDYTIDASYMPGSSVLITSMDDFNTFRTELFDSARYGSGMIFKLTTDLDFNPGWNSHPTVSGGVVTWPSNPGNFTRIRNFWGTLDGQGHTISGIYAERSSGAVDGAFFWHFHGTLKNIAFTNSIVLYNRGTNSGGRNYGVGFLAGDAEGTFENIYLDVEVWAKANNNVAMAGIAPNALGTTTVTNFTFRGRFAVADNSNNYNYSASGQNAQGLLFGNGYAKTITVNHALFDVTVGAPNLLTEEGDPIMLVRYDRGGLTLNDVLTLSSQTSSRAGWTNQMSSIGTWTPSSVVPSRYVTTGNNLALSNYDNRYYYKPGSSFAINTFSDYNTFVSKINADSTCGRGYVFKITADMNINLSWRANGDVDWDGETGSVEYTVGAPGNPWPVMDSFAGTLDGQGHLIEGVYNLQTPAANGYAGMITKTALSGATFKNLVIRNARFVVKPSGADPKIGCIAGYAAGNNTIENVYLDVDMVIAGWSRTYTGAFLGRTGIESGEGANYYLTNVMFAGNLFMAKPSSTNTFALPTTSTGAVVSELIGIVSSKTTTHVHNAVLAGAIYASETIWANGGDTVWLGTQNGTTSEPKFKWGWVLLDMVDYEDRDFEETSADGDWKNDYLLGGEDAAEGESALDITEAFAFSSNLGIQVPAGLQPIIDALTFHNFDPVTIAITDYTGSEIAGSIFTIASATDLQYAVELSQDQDVTFAGYTLRLTQNIDLNPGWDGAVTISDGKATLPNLPTNLFRGFKVFSGTFDGMNYYISGIFMLGTINDFSFHLAPFQKTSGTVVIRRLKLIRGLVLAQENYTNGDKYQDNKVAGLVARNSGTLTIESVYNAMDVWYNGSTGEKVGGFVSINNSGSGASTLTMTDVKFAGKVGTMHSANSVLSVPSSSTSAKVSQLVADGGSGGEGKLTITRYAMSGTAYVSESATTPSEVTTGIGSGTVSATETIGGQAVGATVGAASYTNKLASKSFPGTIYNGGGASTTYEGTHGAYVYTYNSIDFWDHFNGIAAKLRNNGFTGYTLVASYNIGNNYYMQFENPNEYSLFFTFISTGDADESAWRKGRGSVYVAPAGGEYDDSGSWNYTSGNLNTITAPNNIAPANLCTAQIHQLNVDNAWEQASGGMGYIIRMTNGHFIIIDGGYQSAFDARNIYKILCENNVLGGNPQVDGWFLTHLHDDHFGALVKFAATYSANVDVHAFYYNLPSDTVAASEDDEGINIDNVFRVVSAMKFWPNAKLNSKVHAGQTFLFNGLNATVMATHESVALKYYNGSSMVANSFADGNDTSLVVKFTFFPDDAKKKQVFMITGDACVGEAKFLETAYTEADLEADIIQVSHHGWYGLTGTVYEMMDKGTSSNKKAVYLWPQDIIGYTKTNDVYNYRPSTWDGSEQGGNFAYLYTISSGNSKFGQNYGIRTRAAEVIPAYQNECLALPYKPKASAANYWTSGSYTNLKTLYNQKKNGTIVWDGTASGQTPEAMYEIKDWWNDGANEVYEIDSIIDFYEFVRIAKGNSFSGKTVNLNCNITANNFDGTVTFDGTQYIVADGLSEWSPIPTFSGTFNGNGHTISGLYAYISFAGSSGTIRGGFIKTLAGGTITNLCLTNSAFLFKNTSGNTSANMFCGGIVGEATGNSTISNCLFDVNTYVSAPGCISISGVVAKTSSVTVNEVTTNPTLTLSDVTYSGEVAYVTAGWTKGGAVTLTSGQNMYGPMGIFGHSNAGTINASNVKFLGTRTPSGAVSGGSNFSTDIYDASHTGGTVNLTGNNVGSTSGGAAPVAAPTTEGTSGGINYVYVPQLDRVLDESQAKKVNPVYAQNTTPADSKTNVRFVGTINRTAARRAYTLGYKLVVTYKGKTATKVIDVWDVYTSITAAGKTYTAEDLGSEYVYAVTLNNVPQDASNDIVVKVYSRFLDSDGVTERWGSEYTLTIRNGVIVP